MYLYLLIMLTFNSCCLFLHVNNYDLCIIFSLYALL